MEIMKIPNRFAVLILSASVCLMTAGCFSYTRETSHTAVPAVETPETSSTTTTTTSEPTEVERQRTTTTYTNP
jgi:hypothetical protein